MLGAIDADWIAIKDFSSSLPHHKKLNDKSSHVDIFWRDNENKFQMKYEGKDKDSIYEVVYSVDALYSLHAQIRELVDDFDCELPQVEIESKGEILSNFQLCKISRSILFILALTFSLMLFGIINVAICTSHIITA